MTTSSTCGFRRAMAQATMGLPSSGCRPLSTPPMRLPLPPASTMPVTFMGGSLPEMRGRGAELAAEHGAEGGRAVVAELQRHLEDGAAFGDPAERPQQPRAPAPFGEAHPGL